MKTCMVLAPVHHLPIMSHQRATMPGPIPLSDTVKLIGKNYSRGVAWLQPAVKL